MGSTGEGLEMEMEMEMEITGFLAVDPQRSELDKKKKKREKKREKEGPEYWSLQRKKNNRSPTIIVVVSKEEKEERMKKRVQVGFGEKFRTFCENEKLLDATIMSAKDEMDSFLTHFYPLCTDCSAMITSVVALAKHEVQITESLSLLFRRDSPASKLLRRFNSEVGKDYTDNILLDFFDHAEHSYLPDLSLDSVSPPSPAPSSPSHTPSSPSPSMSSSSSPFYSSSPFPSPSPSSSREETEKIIGVSFRFLLWLIEESVVNIPAPMLWVCQEVGRMVGEKFGEEGRRTFAVSYFFLRFLSPALTCPENVQGPVGTEMKKFCILLSKILQMAVSRKQGKGNMAYANGFIEEGEKSIQKVVTFLLEETIEGGVEEVMKKWKEKKENEERGGEATWERTADEFDEMSEREEFIVEEETSSLREGSVKEKREKRKKGLFEEEGGTMTEMSETEMEWSAVGDAGRVGGDRGGGMWVYVDSISYFYDFFNRKGGEIRRNYLKEREREKKIRGEEKEKKNGNEKEKENGENEEKEAKDAQEKQQEEIPQKEQEEKPQKEQEEKETKGEKEGGGGGEKSGKAKRLSRRLSFTTSKKIQKKLQTNMFFEEQEQDQKKQEGEEFGEEVREAMGIVRCLYDYFKNSLIEPEEIFYDPALHDAIITYSHSTHMYAWIKLWFSLLIFEQEKNDTRRKELFMGIKRDHFEDRAPFYVSLTPGLVKFFEEEESLQYYATNLLCNIKPEVRDMIKTLIIPSFLNDYRAKVEKNEEGEGGEGEGEGGGSKRKSVLSRRLFSKTFKDVDGERSYGGGERGSRYSSRASARSEPMGSRTSARSEPITNLAGGGAGGNVAGLVLKRGLSDLSNSMESVSPRGDSSQGSDRSNYSARGLKPSLLPHFINELMQVDGLLVRKYTKDRTIVEQGSVNRSVYRLISGSIRFEHRTMSGKTLQNSSILGRMSSTDQWPFFCELSALGIQEETSAAVVVDSAEVTVAIAPISIFMPFIETKKDFDFVFFGFLMQRLARMLRGLHTRTLTLSRAIGGGKDKKKGEGSYGGQKINNQNVLMGWEGGVRGRGVRGGKRVEGLLVLTYDYVSFVKKKVVDQRGVVTEVKETSSPMIINLQNIKEITTARDKITISAGKDRISVHIRKPTSPETVKGVISTAKTTCKTINTPWLGVGEEGEKARGEEESGEEVGAEKLASSSSSSPRSSLSSLSTSTVLCGGDVEMLVSHFPTKKYSSFELIQEKGTEINRIGYVLEGSLKVTVEHNGQPVSLPDVQKGEIVGEIGAILQTLCSADLRAGGDGCTLIVVPSEFLFDCETNSNFRVRVYFALLKLMWERIIRQEKEQVNEWMKRVEEAGGTRKEEKKKKGKK